MSHLLLVGEMGGELGHLATLSALAAALVQRGDRVTVVVNHLGRAAPLFAGLPVTLLQAPIWRHPLPLSVEQGSLATILWRYGFCDADRLWPYLQAWRHLCALVNPDLVVLDYAPTALLALRHQPVPLLITGFAFGAPLTGCPLPRWPLETRSAGSAPAVLPETAFANSPPLTIEQVEAQVLATINQLLVEDGHSPLAAVADLFATDGVAFTQLAELDPQSGLRPASDYVGPLTPARAGQAVDWQTSPGQRVLAYLKPGWPEATRLLTELKARGCELACFYPAELPEEWLPLLGPEFRIGRQPLELTSALPTADLLICHGGIGSLSLALLAGSPVLCLPRQSEQLLNSQQASQLQVGRLLLPGADAEQIEQCLHQLLHSDDYRHGARRIAARYQDRTEPLRALLNACDRLLARGGD